MWSNILCAFSSYARNTAPHEGNPVSIPYVDNAPRTVVSSISIPLFVFNLHKELKRASIEKEKKRQSKKKDTDDVHCFLE